MTIRVGVIGAGIMGADHIRNLAAGIGGATVSFVADLDPARAAAAAALAGARSTTDPSELIASPEVDAVVIASHDSTHAPLVLECLEALTPVLCEKPLAPTSAECREVVAADADIVAATGRSLLSVGFMRRFDPGYVQLREALRNGTVGAPLMMHCVSRNTDSAPGATTESSISNSAIHELDIVPWLLDAPITEVSWQAGRPSGGAPAGLQDPQLLLIRTADGTLATVELFLNARYGYSTRCEVSGETGALSLVEPAGVALDSAGTHGTAYPRDWRPRFADAYRLQLQAWIASLASGEPSPLATAQEGLLASVAAEAVVESMHGGGAFTAVKLPAGAGLERLP